MKQYHYSRKTRQLRKSVVELNNTIAASHGKLNSKIRSLILKIKRQIAELQTHLGTPKLKHILGATAVFFGLSASAQNFDSPVENPFGLTSTYDMAFPTAVDLDNDGDFDLMVGESFGVLQYFENTGTKANPKFAAPVKDPFNIAPNLAPVSSPSFADLDDDGDQDMLTGGYGGPQVYYENIGTATSPNFSASQLNPFGLDSAYGFSIPRFVDLDGDGDQDVIIAEFYGTMVYYENTGTKSNPQFTKSGNNPFGLTPPNGVSLTFPEFADLDGDGDQDMLLGEFNYGALAYYQNTGTATNPAFATRVNEPFGLDSAYLLAVPTFVDIDDDGDLDLLVGEYYGKMQFYRNTPAVSSINRVLSDKISITLYPNPAQTFISIDTEFKSNKISIANTQGQEVLMLKGQPTKIDVSSLHRGQYFIRLEDEDGKAISTSFTKL
jgi:hypothetical protein